MKERASRFAASAGSEDINLVPDEEENDENESDDDDEFSLNFMRRSTKPIKKPITTNEQSKLQNDTIPMNIDDQMTTISSYECSENAFSSKSTLYYFFLLKRLFNSNMCFNISI